jgi:hypothetical protein
MNIDERDDTARQTLAWIAKTKYGLQGIYEDHHDVNARNYHEMKYWRDMAQRYQEMAQAALEEMGEGA